MAARAPLDRLLRASGVARQRMALRLVQADPDWASWNAAFNQRLVQAPQEAATAAQAMERAARTHRDDALVTRLRLVRGLALHRSGSPREASRLLLEVAPQLAALGEADREAQSLILAVDALAHAGEVEAALAWVAKARRRILGPRATLLRAMLRANESNALRLAGRLDEAARGADAAARAFDRLDQAPSAAACRLNAGVALLLAGHPERAHARFAAAREIFAAHEQTDRIEHADYNLACANVRSGRLGDAIPTLEALAARARTRGASRQEGLCRMDLADALLRAGDAGTAARESAAAVERLRSMDARGEAAEAAWLHAAALRVTDADAVSAALEAARRDAEAAGRLDIVLRTHVLAARHALDHGGRVEGRALAALHRRASARGLQEIAHHVRVLQAQAAWQGGSRARALAHLERLPRSATKDPVLALDVPVLRARMALARREGTAATEALRILRPVTRTLDRVRADLPGAWLQTTFRVDRLEPYLLMVDALLRRGRPADRRRAEEVLDALALERFRAAQSPMPARGRAARLRRRLEDLQDRLAGGGGGTRGALPPPRVTWMRTVRALQRDVADAWRQREREARTTAAPGPRGPLPPDTEVLHVWVRGREVRGLRRRGERVEDLGVLADFDVLRKQVLEVRFHADRVRLTGSERAAGALERGLRTLAHTLGVDDAAVDMPLHLVLDPRLPDLPWEVLPVGALPLSAHRPVVRVPSARLPRTPRTPGAGTCVITSAEQDLPAIDREARHVARGGRVLRGRRATRTATADALQTCRVVHLAMHGASLPHAPALGGVRLADGWFTAADVPLRVGADVVSLAACDTGAPPGPAAQAWGALPSALLRAGARWVLWTAGDVDDETTADLMSAFHPVSDPAEVPERLGSALAEVLTHQGTAARLLAFRLSGGRG